MIFSYMIFVNQRSIRCQQISSKHLEKKVNLQKKGNLKKRNLSNKLTLSKFSNKIHFQIFEEKSIANKTKSNFISQLGNISNKGLLKYIPHFSKIFPAEYILANFPITKCFSKIFPVQQSFDFSIAKNFIFINNLTIN